MAEWDEYWSGISLGSLPTRLYNKVTFDAYKNLLDNRIKKPIILELGCGTGQISARMIKRYGGKATLIDYSRNALEIAKQSFRMHGLPVKAVISDVFKYRSKEKYDLVHSEGLIEHFKGKRQKELVNIHKRFVRQGGYVLISVPCTTWYYRLWRRFQEKRGKWNFGYEKPMTPDELKRLMKACGLDVIETTKIFKFSFALAKA